MSNAPEPSSPSDASEGVLADYIDGLLSPARRAEIEKLLESTPAQAEALRQMVAARGALRGLPREAAPPEILEAVHAQLERAELLGGVRGEAAAAGGRRRMPLHQRLAIAAVLVLSAGFVGVTWRVLNPPGDGATVAIRPTAAPPAGPGERAAVDREAGRGATLRKASSADERLKGAGGEPAPAVVPQPLESGSVNRARDEKSKDLAPVPADALTESQAPRPLAAAGMADASTAPATTTAVGDDHVPADGGVMKLKLVVHDWDVAALRKALEAQGLEVIEEPTTPPQLRVRGGSHEQISALSTALVDRQLEPLKRLPPTGIPTTIPTMRFGFGLNLDVRGPATAPGASTAPATAPMAVELVIVVAPPDVPTTVPATAHPATTQSLEPQP